MGTQGTFIEADHPREAGGQFVTKQQGEPTVIDLTGPGITEDFTHGGFAFVHSDSDELWPDDPEAIAVRANRDLSDADMQRAAQLLGYGYAAHVRGERLGDPVRVDARTFAVDIDLTKSASDDVGEAVQRLNEDLPALLVDGSPVRKTNRAGAGTAGTRLVGGLGDIEVGMFYGFRDTSAPDVPASRYDQGMAEADRIDKEIVQLAGQRHRALVDSARTAAREEFPGAHSILCERDTETGQIRGLIPIDKDGQFAGGGTVDPSHRTAKALAQVDPAQIHASGWLKHLGMRGGAGIRFDAYQLDVG